MLAASPPIAVDLEGTDLPRQDGSLCLLQAASRDGLVYLFDIQTMGHVAMEAGLRDILESEQIMKLVFDPRMDADALLNCYGVRLAGVFDLQVFFCWSSNRNFEYLPGMSKVVHNVVGLGHAARERLTTIKQRGRSCFVPELGGFMRAWENRPLPDILIDYAAADVDVLFAIYDEWRDVVDEGRIAEISKKRLQCHASQGGAILDARRDFPVPVELCTLYVGGIPTNVRTEDLCQELSQYGAIRRLMHESEDRFAFVEFEEHEVASNAVKTFETRWNSGCCSKLVWPARMTDFLSNYVDINVESPLETSPAPGLEPVMAAGSVPVTLGLATSIGENSRTVGLSGDAVGTGASDSTSFSSWHVSAATAAAMAEEHSFWNWQCIWPSDSSDRAMLLPKNGTLGMVAAGAGALPSNQPDMELAVGDESPEEPVLARESAYVGDVRDVFVHQKLHDVVSPQADGVKWSPPPGLELERRDVLYRQMSGTLPFHSDGVNNAGPASLADENDRNCRDGTDEQKADPPGAQTDSENKANSSSLDDANDGRNEGGGDGNCWSQTTAPALRESHQPLSTTGAVSYSSGLSFDGAKGGGRYGWGRLGCASAIVAKERGRLWQPRAECRWPDSSRSGWHDWHWRGSSWGPDACSSTSSRSASSDIIESPRHQHYDNDSSSESLRAAKKDRRWDLIKAEVTASVMATVTDKAQYALGEAQQVLERVPSTQATQAQRELDKATRLAERAIAKLAECEAKLT
eukprot:TRINITY_DN20332_c0_g1_i1.p1 TRINITY_DN20332_c0_g1~~TRINITY_DN20332_c0_g1_i1.p1  ORF type:complete len:795 (-),score=112.28 TRINITY_DN20332_c0_g1_i1:112-2352(-)